jgi:hypothetical protein
MQVHLINPSDVSFGTGVITARRLYVMAETTPRSYGNPAKISQVQHKVFHMESSPSEMTGVETISKLSWADEWRLIREV